jgi:hypothetical protein
VRTSVDRGEIMHLAGFHRLSPALRDGAPVLAAPGDPAGGRCGWAPFFAALERRALAVAWEPGDAGSVRLVRRDERMPSPPRPAPLAEARRFLRAWRGGSV